MDKPYSHLHKAVFKTWNLESGIAMGLRAIILLDEDQQFFRVLFHPFFTAMGIERIFLKLVDKDVKKCFSFRAGHCSVQFLCFGVCFSLFSAISMFCSMLFGFCQVLILVLGKENLTQIIVNPLSHSRVKFSELCI